ncbi:hypothetical protein KKD52_13230 [Myxococcota bacterium]|nr:hypothetical protein [Myxococcota bacterium]MBU1412017.1 hypothetical protein [Myxococcota bacterium]MBU1511317.1 hypothetical protein [Myxococcota bacterium]
MSRLRDHLRSWSLKKRIAVVLVLAASFLFTVHLVGWLSADPMPGARILEVRRGAPGHRDGTLRRYELEVLHRGVILRGHMDTYWYVGKPEEDQVLDLRGSRVTEDHYRFYHGAWTAEFRSWFIMFAVLGLVGGIWFFLDRRRRLRR